MAKPKVRKTPSNTGGWTRLYNYPEAEIQTESRLTGWRAEMEYSVEKPLNREPPIEDLISSFISTPRQNPYDRNHGPIPHLSASTHTLTIDGLVARPLRLSIAQLRTEFRQHTVLSALQCAGNRRHTMRTQLKEVLGVDWFDGAVMNCVWSGPLLRDVLRAAGVDDSLRSAGAGVTQEDSRGARSGTSSGSDATSSSGGEDSDCDDDYDDDAASAYAGHVAFACYQTACQDDEYYGGSIPLARALRASASVILALDVNGAPLTPAHGFPVRALVPGVLGARSVKWLDRVTVQRGESENFYQRRDYKVLPPEAVDAEAAKSFWDSVPAMEVTEINSVVGVPKSGATVRRDEGGCVEVRGYALPEGTGGPVRRVDVSVDGGRTWLQAELDWGGYASEEGLRTEKGVRKVRFAWCLWKAKVKIETGEGRRIVSRATDWAGNVQPEHAQWNLRGVGYNAWGEARDLTIV